MQIKLEAQRQALLTLYASQGDRQRLAEHSKQLTQSVQEQQTTLHALQEQQSEQSAKRSDACICPPSWQAWTPLDFQKYSRDEAMPSTHREELQERLSMLEVKLAEKGASAGGAASHEAAMFQTLVRPIPTQVYHLIIALGRAASLHAHAALQGCLHGSQAERRAQKASLQVG